MSLTLVTSFHPVRSDLSSYLTRFEDIVATGLPILLFLDPSCSLPKEYRNVRVISASLDKSWLPETVSLPANRSLTKDTEDYLVLMLQKMKCMRDAASLCETPYLAWIDFGISHIIRTPDATWQKIRALSDFSYPLTTILVPGCWDRPSPTVDVWNSVYWRFCGGFFLGPRDRFAAAYSKQMEIVNTHLPKLTWEVNYWTMMEEHFTWYPANHDDSMIVNVPYSPAIQRIHCDFVRYIGDVRYKTIRVGGPIEKYVMSVLQPTVTAVFPKTDMLVESAEYMRMRSTASWEDPAIADASEIRNLCQPVAGTLPLLCVESTRGCSDPDILLLPCDDETFEHGMKLECDIPAWTDRIAQVVWRGASSGCEYPSLRQRVVQTLHGHPSVTAKFTLGGWPQNDARIPSELFGDRMTIADQCRFKYMLSIDGNGTASNIQWIFASGCVPILVCEKGVRFWFQDKLNDGVNCILIDPELTTLQGKIEWLISHDAEARSIAEAAQEFARTVFSPESQRAYLRQQMEAKIPYTFDWCEYRQPIGEHHSFLTELAKSYQNATIIDIGTHIGASAYALSREPSNRVISFDIVHKKGLPRIPNVTYSLDNLMTPEGRETWRETLLASPLIFLDIDPHEGTSEYEFYEWLRDNHYQGVLVCDDIWHFPSMRTNFWYKIPYEHKIDMTDKGHCSGTGIVRFVPSERWPANPPISNWTVVTGYFDLTRRSDASPSIQGRPFEHYLQHSASTLMLDQNLVVFCEPHTIDAIRARRPTSLASKTHYVVMNFEDFPMHKYATTLTESRKNRPSVDDRNTVSYYLLCMARYAMLKRAINENPFGSTHFMWLNICIERMGIRNVRELTQVFHVQRDKFSTCYIDYQPRENYLENVMRWGKCSMCSGFFTGNAQYMKDFCDRIEETFAACALQGYGHADEQLFSLVYFDAPDIFEVYYGDYTEMVTNYEYVKERASEPLRLVIPHSFAARDFKTCAAACRAVWKSYELGYAKLSESEVNYLRTMMLLFA